MTSHARWRHRARPGRAVTATSSRAWNTRDKLIGTFVPPGGLAGASVLLVLGGSVQVCSGSSTGPTTCSGGPSAVAEIAKIALLAVLVVAPFFTGVYLARRAR